MDYVVGRLESAGFDVTRQRCTSCPYPSDNIIAEWPGGDTAETYMFGAHLDGVASGTGINDIHTDWCRHPGVAAGLRSEHPRVTPCLLRAVAPGYRTEEAPPC